MELAVTKEAFFENGMATTFVDTMAAFLKISTDRIKIVGVRNPDKRRMLEMLEEKKEKEEENDDEYDTGESLD